MNVPAGQGMLQVRDADEPLELDVPTTISGTVDEVSGAISGATFSTPEVEFDTVALGFDVHVTATFTQASPGSATGLVTATPPPAPSGQGQKGTVALRTSVDVALNLVIGNPNDPFLVADCESTAPVNLELLSAGPYTEAGGGRIVDSNFTVPPFAVNNDTGCIQQVADGVNDQLGGSGHSLSMYIEGDLPVPPIKPATQTTLSVDPSGGSLRGTDVTMTASVAAVEANPLDPTGTVVFRQDTRVVGTAELQPDGTATLTTSDLRSGDRVLTAAYQGDEEFGPSESAPLTYSVAPAPIITGAFPEYIARGGAPIEFDLTVDNTGSPRPVANARVDVRFTGVGSNQWITLERQLPDDSWVPVALSGAELDGTLGPAEGAVVPADAVQTHRLRVSVTNQASIVSYQQATFSLVSIDPDTDDDTTVATTNWPFQVVTATRTATTTTAYALEAGGLRPGQTLTIEGYVSAGGEPVATGEAEFLLDGKVMPTASDGPPPGPLQPESMRQPVGLTSGAGYVYGLMTLPADLSTGPHQVSVRYLGNASYRPSHSAAQPVQVLEPLGSSLYDCDYTLLPSYRFGSYVEAFVRLPSYAVDGEELELDDVEIKVVPGGVVPASVLSTSLPTSGDLGTQDVEVDLGDAGTLVGDGVDFTPSFDPWDQVITLQNLSGTIVVDGEPGEIMSLPIERIGMAGLDPNFTDFGFSLNCTPQDEPTSLGQIGVAGVSLAVATTTDPVRAGDEVVLTATASPAGYYGVIEFFSGSVSLGAASGASGSATLTVGDLPVGLNALSARYYGVLGNLYESDVVSVVVHPAVECPEFGEEGTSATVRLVYFELLGRCPDEAGFDYWKGRLDGGTSPEVFARAISATPEAVGMVVDDAYVTMLGRKADAAGKAFWVQRMISRGGRYDQLLADLGSSAEFWSRSGSSNAGFVGRVYEQLLGRSADQVGQDFWVGRLNTGTSPRALILSLANLDEPLGVLVSESYLEILGRTPDAIERADGITFLRRTGDRSGFYARLIGTQEFVERAQGLPNPED